jgi:hypothetical protein
MQNLIALFLSSFSSLMSKLVKQANREFYIQEFGDFDDFYYATTGSIKKPEWVIYGDSSKRLTPAGSRYHAYAVSYEFEGEYYDDEYEHRYIDGKWSRSKDFGSMAEALDYYHDVNARRRAFVKQYVANKLAEVKEAVAEHKMALEVERLKSANTLANLCPQLSGLVA